MRGVSLVLLVSDKRFIQHWCPPTAHICYGFVSFLEALVFATMDRHTSLIPVAFDLALDFKLAVRTSEHLAQVASVYRQFYGRDLVEVLQKETSGHFGRALHYLILPPLLLDAELVHDAIVGAGTNERVCLYLEGRLAWGRFFFVLFVL